MTILDKVKPNTRLPGFTIVELLVVIAIIAILAAITTISYTGIRQRAIISSLQSDLSNDSTQLKLYQIANDSYPTSNDCSTGPNPAPPKICLKTSPGNTYVNYVIDNGDPQTFCITEENSGINYRVTNNTGPVAGICNTITTNPSGLVATGGIGQIVLNWTAPSDNGGSTITGYKVYQGTSSGSETLLTTIGNVLTYTSTGLSTGTAYYYKVTAVNAIGESGYSNEASATTIIATPSAPAIAVTLNGSNILATISPVTCTAGTIQYGIRSRTNDGTWGSYSVWSSTTTATQAASDGSKYGYQAQARCYSVATTSATSTGTEGTYIKPITAIPTVPVVTANTVATATTWSWTASTGCPVGTSVSYQYDYTIIPSGYDSGWTAIATSPVAFTTSTGGQTYNVNVQAKCYSANASSSWSASGSANYTRPVVYTLTTIAGAGGSVSAGGTYSSGATPTITATPNASYSFSSWSGDTGCSGVASHTITMNANKTCTANFTLDWITIGTQVWAKYNLNVGTMITGTTAQTNNAVLEKYCYNDIESNCTTYGGFYQWNEAMQYIRTQGAQGICPAGSHIPTDNDWDVLMAYLGSTTAGTKLKPGGSSGLNIPLAGYRDIDWFYNQSSFGYLWSSSESTSTNAWYRQLYSGDATVGSYTITKVVGLSVRCVRN